jgi:hypothetical protein
VKLVQGTRPTRVLEEASLKAAKSLEGVVDALLLDSGKLTPQTSEVKLAVSMAGA